MALEIRHAHDHELDIVASIIVDAYAEYAASMSPDAWSMFAQDIANVHGRKTDGEIIVAVVDERLIGTITIYRNWRGTQPGTLAMRLLAVPPRERGSGIGRMLVEWVVDQARQDDKDRVILTAMQMMGGLRDLVDEMGFTRAPELDHEPAPGVRSQGYALDLATEPTPAS